MIDEFQDTDLINSTFFAVSGDINPDTALLLIGDPKQVDGAFRGADILPATKARSEVRARTIPLTLTGAPRRGW